MLHWIEDKVAPVRFIAFVLIALAVTGWCATFMDWPRAFMVGFDAGAAVFLVSSLGLLRNFNQAQMRDYAERNDANRAVLLGIAIVVGIAVLASVAIELAQKEGASVVLVIATLLLSWLFSNTIFALHYAYKYHVEGSQGGLEFGGEPDAPDFSDFLYFAFTIGCAFATSDTRVETRDLRQLVLLHTMAAFVFNIGVVSFTISVLSASATG